jgi:hypothetical protein
MRSFTFFNPFRCGSLQFSASRVHARAVEEVDHDRGKEEAEEPVNTPENVAGFASPPETDHARGMEEVDHDSDPVDTLGNLVAFASGGMPEP